MPILTGDIKLVASQVMNDVPEGGGAPTSTIIVDGVSNAIFPDISELDRAGGRVNLRKLHVSVQTTDVDTYMGSNVIVAEPPADPNISVTLFSTKSTFDRRDAASARVESYLNRGAIWGGILLNNHVAGQRSVQLLQAQNTELPSVGQTLVVAQYEGLVNEISQFVRTTAVNYVVRIYYDSQAKAVPMWVVTCNISDALRYDFGGSEGSFDLKVATGAARVRDTVVADAGTYVGVVPLELDAAIGDFTVTTKSIFTQLVPSAQTETPISDVRTNGLSTALIPTGSGVTQTLTMTFSTSQNLFVGGPIYPGSLSVVRAGVTVTDSGGLLKSAGAQVGTVDYDNGILSLSTNVWGASGGTHVVSFVPATVPELISDQRSIRVTVGSRSLSYAFTMDDPPVARTLNIAYLAQGRWYVLRDNGAGVLQGTSSEYGIGTVNYGSGSVSVTLGALPDVGSSVVIQSYSKVSTVAVNNSLLSHGNKVFVVLNTDGLLSDQKGSKPIKVGGLTVVWSYGAVTKHAYDDGLGGLTGDATGQVLYAQGVVYISPNELLPAGTLFSLMVDVENPYGSASQLSTRLHNAAIVPITIPGTPGYTVPAHVVSTMVKAGTTETIYPTPGNVNIDWQVAIYYYAGPTTSASPWAGYQILFEHRIQVLKLSDDGQGQLFFMFEGAKIVCGAVDYNSAQFTIAPHIPLVATDAHGPMCLSNAGYAKAWNDFCILDPGAYRYMMVYNTGGVPGSLLVGSVYTPPEYMDVLVPGYDVAPTNPTTHTAPTVPLPPTTELASAVVSQYLISALMVPNYTLKGVSFDLGGSHYVELTDGTLSKDPSPTTGGGTPSGSVTSSTGIAYISSWPVLCAPTITNWRALIAPPSVGVESPFTAWSTTFRSAAIPLRTSSVSVLGTLQDGTTFNVTADGQGHFNGTRVKGKVDYQYGLIELYFVNPDGDHAYDRDFAFLSIPGVGTLPADLALLSSIRYNAVSFTYLPLDAAILGIDPVRLPSDGRVPIFRAGGFAVVGHTASVTATVSNSQVIDCARVRLSRVRVVGHDGVVINTGYAADLEAGTVTFTSVAGYSQPVTIEHRIEDMAVVSDVQISGELTFTRPLTHAYPITSPLSSYVSSALVAGDLKARVSLVFDQATWNGTSWLDLVSGANATGTFNDAAYPIIVTNAGAQTERWALVFTSTTTFNIVGEHVGVLGTGSINGGTTYLGVDVACAPINPATNTAYFVIPKMGFGLGWATGNILRINTVGAMFPVWVVRTVQQGPNTGISHSFTLLSRGDVDRP